MSAPAALHKMIDEDRQTLARFHTILGLAVASGKDLGTYLDSADIDRESFRQLTGRGVTEAIGRSDHLYEVQNRILYLSALEIVQHAKELKRLWKQCRKDLKPIQSIFPDQYREVNEVYAEMRVTALRNLRCQKELEVRREAKSRQLNLDL